MRYTMSTFFERKAKVMFANIVMSRIEREEYFYSEEFAGIEVNIEGERVKIFYEDLKEIKKVYEKGSLTAKRVDRLMKRIYEKW